MAKKKVILIIEDEDDLRELYAEVLEDAGFKVLEVDDGQEGLSKALSEKYDLLLLDIMLPRFDGLEILRMMKKKKHLAEIPVVLLTNLGHESIIKEGFALGANGYLIKSEHTPDQVVEEVRNFLEGKG